MTPTPLPPPPMSWPAPPAPRQPAERPADQTTIAVAAATAVLGGFLIGIVTQALQGELPGNWNVLANSGVVWALGAAAIGALMPTRAAAVLGGAASMVVASVSYYWAVDWFEGIGSSGRSPFIWSAVGIVAGGAFGLVGWLVRHDADRRWLALAVVAGVLIGEGRHLVRFVDWFRPAGLMQVALGLALTIVCLRQDRRPTVVLGLVAASAVCYAVADRLIGAAFMTPL